jgi:hypothetical protein
MYMLTFSKYAKQSRAGRAVLLLALALTLVSCVPVVTPAPLATYTPLPTYTPYPTPEPLPTYTPAPTAEPAAQGQAASCSGVPVISSLTVSPEAIQVGESATLQWGLVSNAQAAVLVSPEGRVGVPTPGQTTVQPNHSTTYSLFAICGNSIVQEHVTLFVDVPGGCEGVPVIESLSAEPQTIQPGDVTTLRWGAVENASAAVLASPEKKLGVGTPGEQIVAPSQTTTYALVAFCGTDFVQKNVTVTVEGEATCEGAPVISSFTANPSTINKGESSLLQWGLVANARGAYLAAGDSITGVATPGELEVTPEQTTGYTLVAYCGANLVKSDVLVTVE